MSIQKRKARNANSQPPRPELKDPGDRFFSLAWHFRKVTEREALERCQSREFGRKKEDRTLTYALTAAIISLDLEIKKSSARLTNEGLLPFAWSGTTVFDSQGGAA